ncbi:unnamed protein product [Vitrella brassicaformis CCMP3155]|uniref:Uncharacterized protein n=1 Tax=Vitrella brassicaformis (strain CCMP3155) TaxID=1169540 RepID=A0A0G4ENF5_VITBC|nr:unnamed protein product [Vitrella brassicaformis CCMP3155]|mmetsp:Transcript_26781/g.66635  ORF Transcript_26781/g.66635 Transcript_26781/m.66635 type:complete len:165 (+) Transcript_26781:125-619(+)|eukprot:CEL99068.1 unnamed protein product [Vitrella brassicaformis CCMP3155]
MKFAFALIALFAAVALAEQLPGGRRPSYAFLTAPVGGMRSPISLRSRAAAGLQPSRQPAASVLWMADKEQVATEMDAAKQAELDEKAAKRAQLLAEEEAYIKRFQEGGAFVDVDGRDNILAVEPSRKKSTQKGLTAERGIAIGLGVVALAVAAFSIINAPNVEY